MVVLVRTPADFEIIRDAHWYRIPLKFAPKGIHAEYFAFYFGREFGPQKWAIHYYAPQLGHELATRAAILPNQPNHPRANDLYYKVQLGQVEQLARPIISLRWRRISFIHTTWDRFQDAVEINDLLVDGDGYVDRLFAILKERGISADRDYQVREGRSVYRVSLSVQCCHGRIHIHATDIPATHHGRERLVDKMQHQISRLGGLTAVESPSNPDNNL